ncbi:hypothetical protein EV702DRAFT_349782 [Suillus placidus]|uniref:Uncharacterized protein n=1 Tax=Suillus placidus TaxID=48579 RepID=A0A9P6ZUD0_9AGAM|nr:hypothetical protein EV702DRAFT_349782 [Suillus placidus]
MPATLVTVHPSHSLPSRTPAMSLAYSHSTFFHFLLSCLSCLSRAPADISTMQKLIDAILYSHVLHKYPILMIINLFLYSISVNKYSI